MLPDEIILKIEEELVHFSKKDVFEKWSKRLKISKQTLYRYFREGRKKHYPETVPKELIKKIASVKFMTLDKKGGTLSTEDTIEELKRKGELPISFNTNRSTIDRLMRKYELDISSLTKPSPSKHLVTYFPNQMHEVDATVAPTTYLDNFGKVAWDPFAQARKKPPKDRMKLILYSGWDHFSGCLYAKYYIAKGENSVDLFHFLYEFWTAKKDNALPFYGFPFQLLYTDQGGMFKAKSTKSLLKRLEKIVGFKHKKHYPGAARATGGVEASFKTLKRFEKKLRVRIRSGEQPTLKQLNEWLYEFLTDINNDKKIGKEGLSRNELWTKKVETSLLKSPPCFFDFLKMAYNKDKPRLINSHCEIPYNGKIYYLRNLEDLIGRRVQVWHGYKEEAIFIEYRDEMYGAFYPGKNEVPIGQYKSIALTKYERTKRELKEIAGKIIGTTKDYGFEDPTYVRQDNYPNPQIQGEKIEAKGGVTNAREPLQQEFNPDEAMLYVAMTVGFYWENVPEELKDFVSLHLEEKFLKEGYISREYLEDFCGKFEPVLERHGLFENNL